MGDLNLQTLNQNLGQDLGLDTLTRQHKQILSLIQRLNERPDCAELVRELFIELRVHSILEQQLLFPAVSALIDRETMRETGRGFYGMLALMLEVEQMDQSNEQFARSLAQVAKHFREHAEEQEKVLFPKLEECSNNVDFSALEKRLRTREEELLDMAHAGLDFPFCPHDIQHQSVRHVRCA